MNNKKIHDPELLDETIVLLQVALDTAKRGEDPQLLLIDALVPLQLHLQLQYFKDMRASETVGLGTKQLTSYAINLIEEWRNRINSENLIESYHFLEILRLHYSPLALLARLQLLEGWKTERPEE